MKAKNGDSVGYFQKDPGVTTIYTGNLSYSTTASDLKTIFEKYGKVKYVNLVQDKETNKNTGIAFIQMPNGKHAKAAIDDLNGTELGGRTLKVSIANNRIPAEVRSKTRTTVKKDKNEDDKVETPKKKGKSSRKKRGLDLLFDHLKK